MRIKSSMIWNSLFASGVDPSLDVSSKEERSSERSPAVSVEGSMLIFPRRVRAQSAEPQARRTCVRNAGMAALFRTAWRGPQMTGPGMGEPVRIGRHKGDASTSHDWSTGQG